MRNNRTADKKLIGVISDTHNLLRSEAVEALQGAEMILHAGDVCKPEILQTLNRIAPVIAVRGNNDKGEWANTLPETETIKIRGITIYMLHNLKEINANPQSADIKVVISGHSHKPSIEKRKDVLYINPGSAGPRRFSLPVSLALLTITENVVTPQLLELRV